MDQTLNLMAGWNLISFYIDFNLSQMTGDADVLEMKNLIQSYNSSAPSFLNTLNSGTPAHPKSK